MISTQPLCAIGVRASFAVLAMAAVPVLAYVISFPILDGLNHSFFAEHLRCAADAALHFDYHRKSLLSSFVLLPCMVLSLLRVSTGLEGGL